MHGRHTKEVRDGLGLTIAYARNDQKAFDAILRPHVEDRDYKTGLLWNLAGLVMVLAEGLAQAQGMSTDEYLSRLALVLAQS